MKNRQIKTFYNPLQVCSENIKESSYSKSPLKPKLLLQYLQDHGFGDYLDVTDAFQPFKRSDFLLAHTKRYVKDVFNGTGSYKSNGLPWSEDLVNSLQHTNSSLFHAISYSIENPDTITFSPTSGFHHAQPSTGSGFCTFSGQVIAATKIYRSSGKRAAFLDLDGHFGNSIEDSMRFVKDLKQAIPFNINPAGSHLTYIEDFKFYLDELTCAFIEDRVDYVVWCHGADSHEWDQLGYQCSTEEWLNCSELFYGWIKEMFQEYNIVVPVTLSLFGGYRDDDYDSVLSLHASDLRIGLSVLCGIDLPYQTQVLPRISRYEAFKSNEKVVTLIQAIQEDLWDLQQLSSREIIETIHDVLDVNIEISPKNKQRVIKKAYKILIENDYV